jgi:hypothetical protein
MPTVRFVSAANPAVAGEELAIYLTGLGPLESSGNATYLPYMSVGFSGVAATIDYAGIEPGTPLAVGAGYQMNVTVPSGASPGWNYLGIGVPSCFNYEVLICVTSCADSSLRSRVRSRSAKTTRSAVRPRFPDSPRVVFPRRPETHQSYNGDQRIN